MATTFEEKTKANKLAEDLEFEEPPKEGMEKRNTFKKGGYDCEFAERPPNVIQTECPVCLQTLCEPYQVSCCGYSFCKTCIERIHDSKKPCPTCNEESFTIFHDKRLQRSLYQLPVFCPHKQQGCEWTGELGQLDKHLNSSPQPDKQLEGCQYSEIECMYCLETIQRQTITTHQADLCPKRPFSCEYCHDFQSDYNAVAHNHWPVCCLYPVSCPNECGKTVQRENLETHITNECPLTVVSCAFHHVGCDVKLPRNELQTHIRESLVAHMSLQVASYSELKTAFTELQASHTELQASHTSLQDTVNNLKIENELLKQHLEKTQVVPYVGMPIPGYVELTMRGHEQQTKGDDWFWHTKPFYTHLQGYKMCLKVDANGCEKGKITNITVGIYMMKGEFDDNLKWPFRGQITIQVLHQDGDESCHIGIVFFNDKASNKSAERVTYRYAERSKDPWDKYSTHDKLLSKNFKKDSFSVRITKVKLS